MKYLLYFTFFISISILLSCKKNEQKEICEDIQCSSGRVCENNLCVCIDRKFTGNDCDEQKEPKSISIKSIELLRFPSRRIDGSNWDFNSSPDFYITIYQSINPIWKLPNVIIDGGINQSLLVAISNAQIVNVKEQHTISLYDDDGTLIDEFMGGVVFVPYAENNIFPDKVIVDTGGLVAYELTFNYYF